MKKRTMQLLAGGMCLTLAIGSLAGCGNQGTKDTADTTAKTDGAQTEAAKTEGGKSEESKSEESKAETAAADSDEGSKENVTLNFAASQNWIEDVDKELAKEFEEKTGIAINFQLSPDDQYQTIVKSKLNTGEGPDIFMSYSGTKLKDFNPEKNMVDLSGETWVSELEQWAIDGCSYKGKLYAQNTAGVDDTNGVLYKPAVFEELGIKVPTNYAEFKEACDKLQAGGITPVYEFVKDLWHTHYWMEGASALAAANHPGLYDDLNTNKIGFADVPEFVTALTQLKEMADSGYFGENHMSNIYDNSYDAIASGKYGMIIIHGSYPNEMVNNIDGVNPEDYSMFPSPLADNQYATLTAGGTTKCISAGSKHIEEAKQYFNFLAEKKNLEKLYKEKTVYVSSSVKGIEASPTKAYKDLMNIVGDKQLQGAEASVYFYDGGKISELCQEMFTGSLTPEQVLEEYDSTRRALAKDSGQEGF